MDIEPKVSSIRCHTIEPKVTRMRARMAINPIVSQDFTELYTDIIAIYI